MTLSRKIIISSLFSLISLAPAIFAATLWFIAGQLAHPDRMPIQDFHREWFAYPAMHGIDIHQHLCYQGRVPCLFIAPNARFGAGERGKLLRNQLEKDGLQLRSYGETQGILVLLHGRNGRKENLLPVAERFAAAGFKCVIPDLPAHGDHGDNTDSITSFSTDKAEQDLVTDILLEARDYFDDHASPAGIWGVSLGGAYAVHAAALSPNTWKAIVVVSSFDSLEGVIHDQLASLSIPFPTFAYDILFAIVDYRGKTQIKTVQPGTWARNITTPVLMAHGNQDSLVSIARGQNLFKGFGSNHKRWITVAEADHHNIFITKTPLYSQMSKWFLAYVR